MIQRDGCKTIAQIAMEAPFGAALQAKILWTGRFRESYSLNFKPDGTRSITLR